MWLGPASVGTAGVVLPFVDGATLLFIDFTNFLADEEFLNKSLDCKGASGLLFCMKCKNMTLIRSDLKSHDSHGYILDGAESNPARFDERTDADFWDTHDELSNVLRTQGKTRMQEKEKLSGLCFNAHGVCADVELRNIYKPSTSLTYDSFHCAFANGFACNEFYLFLDFSQEHSNYNYRDMQFFLAADWHWSKHNSTMTAKRLVEMFSKTRTKANKGAESWKGQASEVMFVYPLLRHFASTCLRPVQALQLKSFLRCCDVLDVLQSAKRGKIEPERLSKCISKYMRAFARAYPNQLVKPKHHFMFHIVMQMIRDLLLLDCCTGERKHQLAKQACKATDNTEIFEKSALSRTLNAQLRSYARPGLL